MQKQVDIMEFSASNRLAPLVWSECMGVPMATRMHDAQAVLLRDKLYVRGGYSMSLTPEVDNSKLYIYTLTIDTWDVLDTPVYWFALTTYHSQLILVGGDDKTDSVLTNKLFTRTFNEQWLETLPPLPKRCRLSLAVSFNDYLLVVGGWDDDLGWLGIIQVFNGHHWTQTDSPPLPYYDIKSAILDGVWYLAPGREEEEQKVYCASLDTLLVSCHSTDILSCEMTWRSLPAVPYKFSSLAVFGNRLIAVGRNVGGPSSHSAAIHAYSPKTKSWVHVANLSIGTYTTCCVVVNPLGDLFVVGGANRQLQVFKGQIEDVINHKRRGNSGATEIEVEIKNDLKSILEYEKGTDLKEKVTKFTKKLYDHCQIEEVSQDESSEVKFTTDTWSLSGVEACGEMTVVVYSSCYQQISWPGYGLRLNVPEDCLPEGMKQCTINIKASLAGQYEFPENSHLISAVFWLCSEPMCKFVKPITVEIQHCAKLENVTNINLSFVRAVCSQKQLPYTFKQLPGGNFTSHSSYGVIELNGFSGMGIVQTGSDKRQYCSKIFFLNNYFGGHRIDLIITWDTEAHLNVVKRHYKEEKALPGPDQLVDFEGEEIRIDLPMEETKINDKWTIVPLIDPVVTKDEVDSYLPGKRIPHCELVAHPLREPITRLVHRVILLGAKPPRNMFNLTYMPPTASTIGSPHDQVSEPAKPKLKDLQRELYSKVANEWEDIGIQLDIEEGQLRQINADRGGNSKACLREMLRVWLSRVAPPPSWSAMADALETLGHHDIATHLRIIYRC